MKVTMSPFTMLKQEDAVIVAIPMRGTPLDSALTTGRRRELAKEDWTLPLSIA
jgi:hypothetical protein